MAKLRIFVSSTYYDLKHIRNYLERFIKDFGYEPVLYESGDITFKHDETLDDACYNEIRNCHMQILIIGGRYGSEASKNKNVKQRKPPVKEDDTDEIYREYNSITRQEYRTALDQNIPVFIFIEKQVLAEYDTYKKNVDNQTIKYAHVQNVNVFKLIDEIHSQLTGNFIRGFEKFEDISDWLRLQWSGMFADFLKNDKDKIEIKSLSAKIDELSAVSNALKEYTKVLLQNAVPDKSKEIIEEEDKKIERNKASRFREEYLMLVVLKNFPVKKNIEVYKAFKESETITDFLETIINIKDTADIILFLEHIPYLYTEFKLLKLKYQNIVIE